MHTVRFHAFYGRDGRLLDACEARISHMPKSIRTWAELKQWAIHNQMLAVDKAERIASEPY